MGVSGSLITILIVFVLLLIFRRLDKKNIQLNKVKRYIDRIISRLEVYEKERSDSIALQEANLNELINRANTLNKSLNTRLEIMNEKQNEISASEETIHSIGSEVEELLSMIDAIREKSKDVNYVDGEIQKTKNELSNMKKDFNDLQVYFKNTKENLISEMQNKTKEATENFSVKIDRLKNQILLTEKNLSEKLNNENFVLMNLIKKIKDTFSFSEKNLNKKFDKLRQSISDNIDAMNNHIKTQEEELLKMATVNIHKLGELVKNIETTHMNNKNSIVVEYRDQIKGLHNLLDREKEKFDNRFTEIKNKTLDELKIFHNSLSQIDSEHKGIKLQNMEEMQKLFQILSDKVSESKLDFQKVEQKAKIDFDAKLDALHKTLEEKEALLLKKTENQVANLSDKVATITQQYSKEKEAIQNIINEKIAQLNNKSSDILKKVEISEKNIDSNIRSVIKSTESRLQSLENQNVKLLKDDLNMNKKRFTEELDSKLSIMNDGLEKHIHLLNTMVENAKKNLLENKEKNLLDLDKKLTKIRNDVNHTSEQFTVLEEQLLKNTKDRIGGVNKEYENRFSELDEQYKEFEKTLMMNISKDIANFQDNLNVVLEKYQKSENQLLSGTKIKILNFEQTLSKLNDQMQSIEDEHKNKIKISFTTLSDSLKTKAFDLEKKLVGKSKEVIEKHKLDSKKLAESIKKLESALKSKESTIVKNFNNSLKSFQSELEKVKLKAAKTSNVLVDDNRKKIEGLSKLLESKLQNNDKMLSQSLSSMKEKAKNQINVVKNDLAYLKQTSTQNIDMAIEKSKEHFATLESSYKHLTKESQGLEKNFESTLKDYVKRFNNSMAKTTEEFSKRLHVTEKSTSQASKEFLLKLQSEYEIAKKELMDKSDVLIKKEFSKVEDLAGRVEEINKTIEHFLSKTKVLNDADKIKNQLQTQLRNFTSELDAVKNERKSLSKLEHKISSLKKYGESVENQISKIRREKTEVEAVAKDVNTLNGTIEDLKLKMNLFKKEKSKITVLDGQFKSLDSLTKRVNKNLEVFSDKEAEVKSLANAITSLTGTYEKLDKKAVENDSKLENFDMRSSRVKKHLEKLEEKAMSLSDVEAKFKNLERKLGEIDPIVTFVDDKISQLKKWKDWATPTEENLKEYLASADGKIEMLKSTLERINTTVSRSAAKVKKVQTTVERESPIDTGVSRELEKNIMDLYLNAGWDMQALADTYKLSLAQIRNIIKKHNS